MSVGSVVDEELQQAIALAQQAGARILAHRDAGVAADRKRSGEIVTAADHEAHDVIVEALRERFPSDEVISEEQEDRPPPTRGRCWIVDPLDGTRAFARGDEDFAVLLSLVQDGRPVLSVTYEPLIEQLFVARAGGGAFEGRSAQALRPIEPAVAKDPGRCVIAVGSPYKGPGLDILGESLGVTGLREIASVGLRLAAVAQGEVDAYVDPTGGARHWDLVAGDLLVHEAGGSVRDLRGEPLIYAGEQTRASAGVIATLNPALHGHLRVALSELFDLSAR